MEVGCDKERRPNNCRDGVTIVQEGGGLRWSRFLARLGIGIGLVGCEMLINKRCWLGSWVLESGLWSKV